MISAYTKEGYDYKLACDGFDLSRTHFGRIVLNTLAKEYTQTHCLVSDLPGKEELQAFFLESRRKGEPEHPFPLSLRDKYEIGSFAVSKDNCFDTDYVLFNRKQLEFWHEAGTSLYGLEFLTCVSRGYDGEINNFGFRILDPGKVHGGFKWLFPMGQSATFGLHLVTDSKKLLLCEGAFDAYAFLESGVSNVVGLGAVKLSAGHRRILGQGTIRSATLCQDMDSFGLQSRTLKRKTCFYAPEGKDPFDVYLQHGHVKPIYMEDL